MRYLFLVLVLWTSNTSSQNLLANGSFEDENICSEFHQRCSPAAWNNISINAPLLFNAYSMDGQPLEGTHFIKIIAGNNRINSFRTFASSQLLCGLRRGHNYTLEFNFKASFPQVDSLGILFSSTEFLFEHRTIKEIDPDFWVKDINPDNGEIISKWTKRTITFSATGKEVFFTLGVFKKGDFNFGKFRSVDQELYIYLDKISISPVDKNEHLCDGVDSVRFQLYQQHDRHSMQVKRRQVFLNYAFRSMELPKTSIISVDTLNLPSLAFNSGKWELSKQNTFFLDSFIHCIIMKKIDSIVIEGHTDSVGIYKSNDKLSTERSSAVAKYIIQHLDIAHETIFIRSYADTRPVAPNATQGGRQRNRRVEIYVYFKKAN